MEKKNLISVFGLWGHYIKMITLVSWGHICNFPATHTHTRTSRHTHRLYSHCNCNSPQQQDGQLTKRLQRWKGVGVLALISLFAFYNLGRRKLPCQDLVSTSHPSLASVASSPRVTRTRRVTGYENMHTVNMCTDMRTRRGRAGGRN